MSGLIVGADKWICLSPIAQVILVSNMHHWGMGKKANKESLKRVWKALQKTEKTQGMQYSEAGALLADRQRVLVTAHHSPAAAATVISSPPEGRSWAPQGQPFPLPCSCCSPQRVGAQGTLAVGWGVAAEDVPVSESGHFPGGTGNLSVVVRAWSLISKCL